MQSELTWSEKKLLKVLLERASEEFGNHGCNDFSLIRDGGLSPDEATKFLESYAVALGMPNPLSTTTVSDFALFDYFQKKLCRNGPEVVNELPKDTGDPWWSHRPKSLAEAIENIEGRRATLFSTSGGSDHEIAHYLTRVVNLLKRIQPPLPRITDKELDGLIDDRNILNEVSKKCDYWWSRRRDKTIFDIAYETVYGVREYIENMRARSIEKGYTVGDRDTIEGLKRKIANAKFQLTNAYEHYSADNPHLKPIRDALDD